MSKKMMMLALAVVSAAMFALPAVASATFLHAHKTNEPAAHPGHFSGNTVATSELTSTGGLRLHGTSTTVTGAFETTTTGWLEITFHGVTGPFGLPCKSTAPAEVSGTVKTTKLTFHLVTIDPGGTEAHKGILITPAHDGVFAHIECAGVQRTISGNGIVGTILKPNCNEPSLTAEFKFEKASQGHQKHKLVTGVPYNLVDNTGSSSSMDAQATVNFAQSSTLTCT